MIRSHLWTFVPFWGMLDKLDSSTITAINYRGDGHGKPIYLKRVATLNQLYAGYWEERVKSIRAGKLEIISTVACPVVISHEKTFVDFAKDLRPYILPIGGL